MAQYRVRHRSGRSHLQKAQTHTLTQGSDPHDAAKLDNKPSSEKQLRNSSNTVHMPTKMYNKKLENVHRLYRNALQREKRAKAKVVQLRKLADSGLARLLQVSLAQDNAQRALDNLKQQEGANVQELSMLRNHINLLEQKANVDSKELVRSSVELEKHLSTISNLENCRREAYLAKEALRKRLARVGLKLEHDMGLPHSDNAIAPYALKNKAGVIKPNVRDMLRRLTCQGVATECMSEIINIVAEGLGIQVTGSVSARSAARIMLEGLVQARMQVAHELSQSNYFTICSDGTCIKNQQFEAKSMYIQPFDHDTKPASDTSHPVHQTLGVQKAVSHTASHQLDGWIRAIDTCCQTLDKSLIDKNTWISSKMVAPKLRGVLTDHAADQKLFHELIKQWKITCDHERRAVSVLKSISTEEQLDMLSKYLDNATEQVRDWRALPLEKQAALMHDAWLALAMQIGEREFQTLSSDAQFDADFFAWTGCCMHKELNTVKGGVAQMARAWKDKELTLPIALKNKFEVAKNSTANEDKSTRGRVKLASLAGALFRNKDDKRGYQYTVDDYFKKVFGYSNRFPDTSNTRYGSYCNAATELILHTPAYIQLLELLRDAKATPGFTNIERNIFYGLQDTSTLTELAVLALYAQSIGRPYMRKVCDGSLNAMDLGSFHEQVKRHCRSIINNPDLLLLEMTCATTGTLDGQAWDRPDVIYRVIYLAPSLPNICPLLIAFFQGALTTWEQFTTEFSEDGAIGKATTEQRRSAWRPPTNDVSEGALGQCRQMLRRAPTMTNDQRNARVMWQRNGTYEWSQQKLTSSDDIFIRREAWDIAASRNDQNICEATNAALEVRAAHNRSRQAKSNARKLATKVKLDQVELIMGASYETLSKMRIKELDLQLDKLRGIEGSHIPAKSGLGTKEAKIKAILAEFQLRNKSKPQGGEANSMSEGISSRNGDTDTIFEEKDGYPEDEDMYFDNESVI